MASATSAAPPAAADSPSTLFARSLKTYGEVTYGPDNKHCSTAVVDFNADELIKRCSSSSPEYDPTVCDFDAISRELFIADETWISRDLAFVAATNVAQLHGWHAILKQEHILCNRYGEDKSKRNLTHKLPAGCTWKVAMRALVKERYFPENSKAAKPKPSYQKQWDKPIVITSAVCTHGGNCKPSRSNRIAVVQRAGKYVEAMPTNALYSLCNYMENGGKLSSSLIKRVLQPVWPRAKEISKHDVFNIRVKVMRLLPVYRDTNGEYEEWKKVANANEMLRGIDNSVSLDDDEAYELAHTLCLEVMESANGNDDEIFSFIEYLDLIQARAKGFTYKLARDESGGKKKLLGVLWQTATMRRNFELFGSYICLDMMKRGINTLLWPYVAVSMYDEMKKLCIGCEGILCGERTDMYKFLSTFLAESSPGRPLSEVLVVAGDGVFDEELIAGELGFAKAVYFSDQWHLVDSGLEKMFGKAGYSVLKGHLEKMVYASSAFEFDDTLRAAKELLQAQQVRNGQWESELDAFAARRHTYSSYCLELVPGNRGLHGNAASEQNHSSALSYLNDGDKSGNNYCEHPLVLIRDLMKRQGLHVKKANKRLFDAAQEMRVERARLNLLPRTATNADLLLAANHLSKPYYERYKKFRHRADQDLRLHAAVDPTTNAAVQEVRSLRYTDAPPRVFRSPSDRCNCRDRMAELDMCPHEILAKNGFQVGLFQPMHLARECVAGSLVGWTDNGASGIDEILGYAAESLVPSPAGGTADGISGDAEQQTANPFTQNVPPPQNAAPPPGYVAERGGTVQPLDKKTVKNIFDAALASFGTLNPARKMEMSLVALQLQDMLTKPGQSNNVQRSDGMCVAVPTNTCRLSQPKNRPKPRHEHAADARSKKLKTSLQGLGLSQVIVGKEHSIHVNGKSSKKRGCQFCGGHHAYPSCDIRVELKREATEYMLTTEDPQAEILLRNRITSAMPLSDAGDAKGAPITVLASKHRAVNFIIHEACQVAGQPPGRVESMSFCVSFLQKGCVTPDGERLWVAGCAMNALLAHSNKKIKFVFDQTIFHKEGWIHSDAIAKAEV